MGRKNSTRKVDKKWKEIFDDYPILEEINNKGFFKITSSQINEYREARLMTKFDHKKNLPILFIENDITILPITRGEYIIGNFDAYQRIKLNYDKIDIKKVRFPQWLESINTENLYSETSVLKSAFISGMLNDLIGRKKLVSTVSGRMSTNSFEFNITNQKLNLSNQIGVENSQCEIDGGYETDDKLMLIEAKNAFSKDFIIRQLYYPYRLWSKKINKEVLPVFMMYSNDVFSFFVYKFIEQNNYNSLKLINQKNYVISSDKNIKFKDLKKIYQSINIEKEPKVPFPQADSFNKVLDLVKVLYDSDNGLTKEDISTKYDFDSRQAHYYSRAVVYLGLGEMVDGESSSNRLQLSEKGKEIIGKSQNEKNLEVAKCILKHKIFYEVFKLCLNNRELISKDEIIEIMKNNKKYIYNVSSENTIERRAQTVSKWIQWILNLSK